MVSPTDSVKVISSMSPSSSYNYRVYTDPRISANQLAEYTLASPSRRQSILKNAKYAPTFLVSRYSAAKAVICAYLSDDARSKATLFDGINEQKALSKGEGSEFAKNDAALSAEAIESFNQISSNNNFPKCTFTPCNEKLPKLDISGVAVSINIDLVSRVEAKGLVGGVILQTSKAVSSKSWREDHGKNVATLIWMLASEHMGSLGKIDRKICLAVDVFGLAPIQAPANYKTRLNNIVASCNEIYAMWDSISPPSDYVA